MTNCHNRNGMPEWQRRREADQRRFVEVLVERIQELESVCRETLRLLTITRQGHPQVERTVQRIEQVLRRELGRCGDVGLHGSCERPTGHDDDHRAGDWTWRVLPKTGSKEGGDGR
jgi:hypothetical protein